MQEAKPSEERLRGILDLRRLRTARHWLRIRRWRCGGLSMSAKTKAQCYELAAQHGITIQHFPQDSILINLPDGFQFDEVDDQQGFTCDIGFGSGATNKQVWNLVHKDIEALVSMKPWFPIPGFAA
jgi:hypothetical protein